MHHLTSFEFHRGPRGDRNINVGLVGIAADSRAGEANLENPEVAQLNAVALGECVGDVVESPLDHVEDIALDQPRFIADGDDKVTFGEIGHNGFVLRDLFRGSEEKDGLNVLHAKG